MIKGPDKVMDHLAHLPVLLINTGTVSLDGSLISIIVLGMVQAVQKRHQKFPDFQNL